MLLRAWAISLMKNLMGAKRQIGIWSYHVLMSTIAKRCLLKGETTLSSRGIQLLQSLGVHVSFSARAVGSCTLWSIRYCKQKQLEPTEPM